MVRKKYYVVKVGRKTGIYETWDECQENVYGYKGALYKSFTSRTEAERYLNENLDGLNQTEITENSDYDLLVSNALNDGRVVAFTDGGWDSRESIAGYGIYILPPEGEKTIEISDIVKTNKFNSSRNITAEIMAVITAFDWAISNQYDKITIFHDYKGVGEWGRRSWKTKSDIAEWFVAKLNIIYENILDIEYIWVPGHCGIQYNEEADRLATEAIHRNTKPHFKMSETYFSCQNVGEKDVIQIVKLIETIQGIKEEMQISDSTIKYKFTYGKEKLTINFYRKKSLTLVQGKPNFLFSLFVSYYTEKISDFELVTAYAQMHKKKIETKDINKRVDSLNLPDDFPSDAIKLIKQGFSERIVLSSNRNVDKQYDYGHYIFPLCRALEGNIKYLFEKCNIHIAKRDIIGKWFTTDKQQLFILKNRDDYDSRYRLKLESSYRVYNRIRNVLGHFGELLGNDESGSDTMIIDTSEEAIAIMDEILEVIQFD